ncbi:hypothetical protein [Yinghuangia sp. YIM S09857]|uniref:hypothetical protein n=1 Tax=Yinghuangia sp. YIM S09857 TaxID=3436929 RepID=UPI003F534DAE
MAMPVVTYANCVAALQGQAAGTPGAALANAYAAQLNLVAAWPAGMPGVQLNNANLPEPKAHYDGTTNTIVVDRAPAAAPVDVLDALLYEVQNVLNAAVGVALALPRTTPVGTYAASLATAEFMTLKHFVDEMLTVLYGGGGLAALTAPGALAGLPAALPPQALRTLTNWVNTYVPIYTNNGIAVGNAMGNNAADGAAALQFTSTPHNPGGTGPNLYLATYSTFQVYHYERVFAYSAAEVEAVITTNYPAGTALARRYRAEWNRASLPNLAKIGLYACLVDDLQARHVGPAAFPVGLVLPALLDTNSKNDLTRWLNANTSATVISAFSKELVASLLRALGPANLDNKWRTRGA